jgi:hypothetical protein
VGRGATRGSKPEATTGAGWQAAVVVEPVGGSWVPLWKPWNHTSKENLGQLDWVR